MLSQMLYKALIGGLSAIFVLVVWHSFVFLKDKIKQNKVSYKEVLFINVFALDYKAIWFTFIVPVFAFIASFVTFSNYGTYILLKVFVTLQSVFYSFKAWNKNTLAWQAISVFFAGIAIIFCPIFHIRMDKADWQMLDLLFAITAITANIFLFKENVHSSNTIEKPVLQDKLYFTLSKLKLPQFTRIKKVIAAIIIIGVAIVALPKLAIQYYSSVLLDYPRIDNIEQYQKMSYNFFVEVAKQYPVRPANFQEFKNKQLEKSYQQFLKVKRAWYDGGYRYSDPPKLSDFAFVEDRYADSFLDDNFKKKGYVQCTELKTGTKLFLDRPLHSLYGVMSIEVDERLQLVGTAPFDVYIDKSKVYNMPYTFFYSQNKIYIVDSNGDTYLMPKDTQKAFYEIQKKRQDARHNLNFLQDYF